MLSVLVRVTLECLCSVCGVITFAYYAKRGCDPLEAGVIDNPNQVGVNRCFHIILPLLRATQRTKHSS